MEEFVFLDSEKKPSFLTSDANCVFCVRLWTRNSLSNSDPVTSHQ